MTMNSIELFKPDKLADRFTIIRTAKGLVTIDFDMDHIEFSERGGITEMRINNGNCLTVRRDSEEYAQSRNRYQTLMGYFHRSYETIYLQKFSQEKCFAFESPDREKVRLDGHINMLMYASNDEYNARIDLSKDIFQKLEEDSPLYQDGIESFRSCLKLMEIQEWGVKF